MIEVNKIYCESNLATMARMPSESVQCVVTSPPYYGLRSYKTEPQIWETTASEDLCWFGSPGPIHKKHIWGKELAFSKQDNRTIEQKIAQGATVGSNQKFNDENTNGNSGSFCQQCSAWRGELGLEPRFQDYIRHLLQIFAEVKRVLKPDGCVFVNLGDSYAGSGKGIGDKNGHGKSVFTDDHISKTDWSQIDVRAKSLMNIPHRFFIGMTDELQMIQRNNINWWKRACMPSSAKDRWTVDFESIGFFTKNAKYKFNQDLEPFHSSVSEITRQYSDGFKDTEFATNKKYSGGVGYGQSGRNARTTWDIAYEPSSEEHYASYPTRLVERMIMAGSDAGDLIYDPFGGTSTTAVTAHKLGRNWICSELQPKYVEISNKRLEPYLAQESLF